jgi:methionyl-tRNA synthetase
MSKSKLTGIAPEQITETFGADAFRYYFMRAISFGQDGSFSWEDLSARYQAELANGFGNLASRVIAMVGRYRDGVVPVASNETADDLAIRATEKRATDDADAAIERFAIHEALAAIWTLVDELNGYITIQEPWALSKDPANAARLDTVLATVVHGLGTLAVLLSPFIPTAAAKLWTAIGGTGTLQSQDVRAAYEWKGGATVTPLESSLFPRIEQTEAAGA